MRCGKNFYTSQDLIRVRTKLTTSTEIFRKMKSKKNPKFDRFKKKDEVFIFVTKTRNLIYSVHQKQGSFRFLNQNEFPNE